MKKIFHRRYRKHLLEPELDVPENQLLQEEFLREVIYHKKIHSHLKSTFSHIEKIGSEKLKDEIEFRQRLLDSLKREREAGRASPGSGGAKGRQSVPGSGSPFFRFHPFFSPQMAAMVSVFFLVGIMGWTFFQNGGPGFSESGRAKGDAMAHPPTGDRGEVSPVQNNFFSGNGSERLAAPVPVEKSLPPLSGSSDGDREGEGPTAGVPSAERSHGPDDQMTEKVLTLRFAGATSRKEKIDITEKLIRFYRDRGRTEDLHRMEEELRILRAPSSGVR